MLWIQTYTLMNHYKYTLCNLVILLITHTFVLPTICFPLFPLILPASVDFEPDMVGATPCASCKLLRRRCAKDCIFAPYFPPDDPHKFAIVHKIFGASNVSKMLQEIPVQQRGDAVSSLVFEANARSRDPVYGCVGAISYLQNQVSQLQMQLAVAQAEILCFQMQQQQQQQDHQQPNNIPITTQQMMSPDEKSLLLSTSNFDYNLLQQQYLNFGSTTSNIVMQDPPKRESLWT